MARRTRSLGWVELALVVGAAALLAAPLAGATSPSGATARSPVGLPPGRAPIAAAGIAVGRPSLTNATIDIGQTTTVNVSVSGGTAPYTYNWQGLPSGCTSQNASSVNCAPDAAGIARIWANVSDAQGLWADSPHANLTVNTRVMISAMLLSSATVGIGQNVTITVEAGGGTGVLAYAYTGLPDGCEILDSPTLYCHPTTPGIYLVLVTVVDVVGERALASETLNVSHNGSIAIPGPGGPILDLGTVLPVIIVVVVAAIVVAVVAVLGRKRENTPPD